MQYLREKKLSTFLGCTSFCLNALEIFKKESFHNFYNPSKAIAPKIHRSMVHVPLNVSKTFTQLQQGEKLWGSIQVNKIIF